MEQKIPTLDDLFAILPTTIMVPNYRRGDASMVVYIKNTLEQTIQDKKYHAEGNVMNHLRLVYTQILHNFKDDEDLPILLTALVFHDIAKPETMEQERRPDGSLKVSHIGHEHVATKYMDVVVETISGKMTVLERFIRMMSYAYAIFNHTFMDQGGKIREDQVLKVRNIVKEHMCAHIYFRAMQGDGHINKKKERWKNYEQRDFFPALKKFAHCDDHGRYKDLSNINEETTKVEETVEDDVTGQRFGYIKTDYK